MYLVSCLCGRISQAVQADLSSEDGETLGSLCHCHACRHATGLLCASYYPIKQPEVTKDMRSCALADGSQRYFCTVCGCHVFRSAASGDGGEVWGLATGAAAGGTEQDSVRPCRFSGHAGLSDTKDGGAAVWLRDVGSTSLNTGEAATAIDVAHSEQGHAKDQGTLPASCACGTVRFFISRPDADSYRPHSTFPDLTHNYRTTDASNPSDEKWWICGPDRTKYRAGTCACCSCRKASGFEIQAWAFVPRTNIFFHIGAEAGDADADADAVQPLDFAALPNGLLHSFASSEGVLREFCGVCGATVFWHDAYRPDVIDVSVGLLDAAEGARAERWLEWWTDRVSFSEDVETGRSGPPAVAARDLITALEKGMQAWASEG